MKFKNSLKLIFFFVLFAAAFEACQKDDQTTPSTSDRDKFLGTWITHSTGTSGPLDFTMNITAGASNASQIKMENFDLIGNGKFVFGYVSGNSVSIPQSSENVITGDTIAGSGTYNSNNTISFNYTVVDGQTIDIRTATANK